MPELHQVVDQIRAIVQSNDQTRSVLLDGLSSAYAQACGEVNQRLGRCHRLLQQGLRSEAIQLAEAEPKLLDASAALDFPERSAWDELVAIYNLTPAARIMVDSAQFLNQAYAEQEPLADLLRTHRRLALQRSPLSARIAVIRQLAAQDSNNLIWADDLKTFEQARFREMQDEAGEAVRVRGAARLAKLIEELQAQKWLEPPPKGLLPRLIKAEAELRGLETRSALAEVESRLNDAFVARDPIAGRTARQAWDKLVSAGGLGPDDPSRKRARPIVDWLDELDRQELAERDYNEGLTELTRLLDDHRYIPPRALERAARSVLDFGRGMDEELQRRYVARVQAAETNQRRRLVSIVACSAIALFTLAWLSFVLVRSQMRESRAEQASNDIRRLIDPLQPPDGGLETAENLLATIAREDSEILHDPRLSQMQAEVHRLRAVEDEKNASFEELAAKVERGELVGDDPIMTRNLQDLAGKNPAKRERIAQIVNKGRQAREEEARRAAQELGPMLEQAERAVEAAHQRLDAHSFDSIVEVQAHLDQAGQAVRLASASPKSAGGDFQARIGSLRTQLADLERNVASLKHKFELAQQISETLSARFATDIGMRDRFPSRLAEYVKAFPEEPESRQMEHTLTNERMIWEAIGAWNALAAEWQTDSGTITSQSPMTPQIAATRAEQAKRFLERHASFPAADEVSAFGRHAEAIRLRESGDSKSPKRKLKERLKDFKVDGVYMVTLTELVDGKQVTKTYYGPSKGESEGSVLKFQRYLHVQRSATGPLTLDRTKVMHLEEPAPAPQTRLVEELKRDLADQATPPVWEHLIVRHFTAILKDQGTDPILKVVLLRMVLDLGCEGSEPMHESALAGELQKELTPFAKEAAGVDWINPEERDVERFREEARRFVQTLERRPIEHWLDQIAEQRRQIESRVQRSYRCVGWLHKEQGWQRKGPLLGAATKQLIVAVPADQSSAKWRPAGELVNGRVELVPDGDPALVEGRPVFVVE
jgi:hypothetical protein